MDIREFFELPEDVRDEIIRVHNKQSVIRDRARMIKLDRDILNKKEAALQQECEHTFAASTNRVIEDEYGRRTGASENQHYCPDCDLRWTTWNHRVA